MNFSPRLEAALIKLYTAFHNDTLNPECCKQCAVGNILDNKDYWKHITDHHGSTALNYVGRVNEVMGKRFNGYSPIELLKIESTFLNGCGYDLPFKMASKRKNKALSKSQLFKGLESTIKFLLELDGKSNMMDCTDILNLSDLEFAKDIILE